MQYEIPVATAESIVSAIDAILCYGGHATLHEVADFLSLPEHTTKGNLEMAVQIGLLSLASTDTYETAGLLCKYLVTTRNEVKSAVVRVLLEQYEPFEFFRNRISLGVSLDLAAEQLKTRYSIPAHKSVLKDTLVSLGTYAGSLQTVSGGRVIVSERVSDTEWLEIDGALVTYEQAETLVYRRLGERVSWLNNREVVSELTMAFSAVGGNDPVAVVVHIGNATDSFLSQLANHHGVNISSATGINGKVDVLRTARKLNAKHKAVLKFIGHYRNAADHGTDSEIGQAWNIDMETAHQIALTCLSAISSIIASTSNVYVL